MKFITTLVIALISIIGGWYLHDFFSPTTGSVSQVPGPVSPEPVDLRSYQTQDVIAENKNFAPRNRSISEFSQDLIRQQLQQRKYPEAVTIYSQSSGKNSGRAKGELRNDILTHVTSLYQNNAFNDALALLNEYLENQYDDVVALQLKADVLAAQKNYLQQIRALYDTKSYAYQVEELEQITGRIRASVDHYRKILLNTRNHAELLTLYQELVYLEPDYSPYFIELAKAQLKNQLPHDARQSLELVVYDPLVGAQAQHILSELAAQKEGGETGIAMVDDSRLIPLYRRGNHFVVQAILNGQTSLNLMIDTGASLTVIKPESLRGSITGSLDKYPAHRFNTANGVVKAPVLSIGSLAIGEFEVANLHVGGLSLTNTPGVDGLLGMNFLKHFKFFIDQENNLLRLSLSEQARSQNR